MGEAKRRKQLGLTHEDQAREAGKNLVSKKELAGRMQKSLDQKGFYTVIIPPCKSAEDLRGLAYWLSSHCAIGLYIPFDETQGVLLCSRYLPELIARCTFLRQIGDLSWEKMIADAFAVPVPSFSSTPLVVLADMGTEDELKLEVYPVSVVRVLALTS
jgi:hypothetical protein